MDDAPNPWLAARAEENREHIWVCYADTEDPATDAIVKVAIAAHVEKACEESNFGSLGIGA